MVRAMAVLLLCQLAGTVIQQATRLPIPGPVLGLVMLLGYFLATDGPAPQLRETAQGLLKYLGLLFVPAGVGVMTEFQALQASFWAIVLAVSVSTVLGLLVTGLLMSCFTQRRASA